MDYIEKEANPFHLPQTAKQTVKWLTAIKANDVSYQEEFDEEAVYMDMEIWNVNFYYTIFVSLNNQSV